MSRIGNKLIHLEEGVSVTVENNIVLIKGSKGEDKIVFDPSIINVEVNDNIVKVTRLNEEKKTKQMHGTTRALIANAIHGCHNEFVKILDIIGIGYRAEVKGNDIVLNIGYSHPITITPLEGVSVKVFDAKKKDVNCSIEVRGISKFKVGQTAALIRDTRRPEPYQGKGIKYRDEVILRKEGKRAGKK